jgi:hypothetical protein
MDLRETTADLRRRADELEADVGKLRAAADALDPPRPKPGRKVSRKTTDPALMEKKRAAREKGRAVLAEKRARARAESDGASWMSSSSVR